MQNEFINIAAHEVCTPIQPILSLSSLIGSQSIDPKKQQEIIDIVVRNAGSDYVWLWIAVVPKDKKINLDIRISPERTLLVVDQFIHSLIRKYGKHDISTDGGGTWYRLQAYRFLNVEHHIHYSIEKRFIEDQSST